MKAVSYTAYFGLLRGSTQRPTGCRMMVKPTTRFEKIFKAVEVDIVYRALSASGDPRNTSALKAVSKVFHRRHYVMTELSLRPAQLSFRWRNRMEGLHAS